MTAKTISAECYEDNAGRLLIVALEETNGEEPELVWGATYYGQENEAAQDWGGLVVQGLDPVADGWEGLGADELERAYYEDSWAHQIADSGWGDPVGIDLGRCGEAGKRFAIEAGAAYECPECGEVCPTVRDVVYPNSWVEPERCECCGAALA